uniref:Uncharacterized protein n=1 Tax=Phytophthora ramorum TaxID=164328 RepID=H3GF43_PHYRM
MSGTRYTVDPDGDMEMSIPQPIFEDVKPPELSSWDHAVLIEWHRDGYRQELPEAKDAEKTSYTCCHMLKNEFVPDVTSLFRQRLKMDLSLDDCDARIFRYYEDFNGIVEDNALQGLIGTGNESDEEYKGRMKARCRLLVDNIQPPVLKAQINRLIELERHDCKSDDVALFDLILEHAKVQQRFHWMSQDHAAKTDSKSSKPERKQQRQGSARATQAQAQASPLAAASAPATAPVPPHDGCLFCKGAHWLKDCPTATDAQRAEAREKFKAAKEQRAGALRSGLITPYTSEETPDR